MLFFINFIVSVSEFCTFCSKMNIPVSDFDTIYLYKQEDGDWTSDPILWHNRGFLFGDGLFETMVFNHGKIRFAEQHLERLNHGLDQLGIDKDRLSKLSEVEEKISELALNAKTLRIRWNVFRSGIGKYTPEENFSSETLMIQPFQKAPSVKFNAYISTTIRLPDLPWIQCKTLSALPYVMAAQERDFLDMDEVILKNSKGFISEAGASNIFWIKNGIYYTPSLSCSCIAGVGRNRVIQRLKDLGKAIIEGEFMENDLSEAEKVFTTNVTGISYIYKIGDIKFDTTPDPWIESVFEGVN
ncbi:branched-chain amino acid aminotransferase [Cecembia calidifontis]|uniref:branched-chain-amino-acid transaminase n=1 Tax=Cecembia calidifontis TaxID=1187080 RepID=A0A4Q7PAY9_9BACT|nr:branched-chain amino acid aminotransferase [Cecembia calidifontis]